VTRFGSPWLETARKAGLIIAGSFVFALGVDMFEIPNGLAAGGITGLATTIAAITRGAGFIFPVGIQTIIMNVLLLVYAYASSRDFGYVSKSILGILASGLFMDLLAPVVVVPTQGQLLISALWGGVVAGLGLGMVFLSGGNTGGTDIICQAIARKTGLSLGSLSIIIDCLVLALSVPVFSLTNALYAGVAVMVTGYVMDMVLEGPLSARVAYVISDRHDDIAREVLETLDRGCTQLEAKGMWSQESRPVLMVVMGKGETRLLKEIVSRIDPAAIIVISEVHEAFGEGFGRLDS